MRNGKDKDIRKERDVQRLISAKISFLQMSEELGNIQKACKVGKDSPFQFL